MKTNRYFFLITDCLEMNLIQCELIILNVKKKCFFPIRFFFGTTPLLSSYNLFEKEKVAYFSMKSPSFASFFKVDFLKWNPI